MADNPYAPPKSYVADADATTPDGDFIPKGRSVAAGNGWRWIADAWTLMGRQFGMFIGVCLLAWFLKVVVSLVPFIGGIAYFLIAPVVAGGMMLGFDAARRGERLEVEHLFAGFRDQLGKLVALGAVTLGLYILIVIVVVAIAGLSLFTALASGAQPSPEELRTMGLTLVLAGLVALALFVPLAMLTWFSPALIMLANFELGAALSTSFSACLRNFVPFLVWGVIMLVFCIVASIPIFLGFLLLGPVISVTVYTAYRDIFYETA